MSGSSSGSDFNPLSLISAPVSGLFNLWGAKKQSDAANEVADKQTAAAKYAADQQQQSAANTLAFQKRQAQQDFLNAENAQHGNYDQWSARQGRLSTLGQMVGMQPFVIPAYRPLQQATDPQAPLQLPPSQGGPQAPPSYVAQPGQPALNPNVTTMGNAFLRMPNGQDPRLQRQVIS